MFENNSAESTDIEVKNLSNIQNLTYGQALSTCKKVIGNVVIPTIFELGRKEGKTGKEIMTDLEATGFSYRTIIRNAPEWAKQHQERFRERLPRGKVSTIGNARLVIEDEEPTIPPPEQPIIEQEPAEPEPTGDIIRIEMDWGHCNFFVKWFRQELVQHQDKKNGKYIIEYNLLTKEIEVDMIE